MISTDLRVTPPNVRDSDGVSSGSSCSIEIDPAIVRGGLRMAEYNQGRQGWIIEYRLTVIY
jgi:hypothetical protein